MRHKTSILTGMAAILVLLFAPPMNMAGEEEAAWTVVAASGQVEITTEFDDPARWEPVARGMNLAAASRIRTGADGRATLVWKGSIIVVDPDSHLEIPVSDAPGQPARFFQESGSAVYSIKKARKNRFQVITPYLVAGVKGTLFRVSVSPEATSVLVSEGVVSVSALDGWDRLDVRAGERVHLNGLPGSRLRMEELQMEEMALSRRDFNAEQVKARRVTGTDTRSTGEGNELDEERDFEDTDLEESRQLDSFEEDDAALDLYDEMIEELDKELRPEGPNGKPSVDPAQQDPSTELQS